jgi:hypothetical protein
MGIVRLGTFFALIWLGPLAARADLSVSDIIARTLQNDEARQRALASMRYDQVATIDQLDRRERVTRHEVLTMIVSPGSHPPLKVTALGGDQAPPLSDHAAVQALVDDVGGNQATFTLRDLASRFVITLEGHDVFEGAPVYVLSFAPRQGESWKDDTEKVVNRLHGQIWISSRTWNVLRTEAALTGPVRVAWFLATVPTLRFEYRTQDSESGFAASQERITLEVDALFVGYHERQTIQMSHFVRAP